MISSKIYINIYTDDLKEDVISLLNSCEITVGNNLPEYSLVAVFDNKIVGYIGASLMYGETAMVNILAVHPVTRRNTIATELVRSLIHHLDDNNIKYINAYVQDDNIEAVSLYRKLNFPLQSAYIMQASMKEALKLIEDA